jgi:DNA adenine methylase
MKKGVPCKGCGQCHGHGAEGGRARKLLPYAGGKFRLVRRLVELMPQHKCFVEVFGGGAALLATKPRVAGVAEILNDVDGRLVNLYRVAKHHPEALELELALLLRSRAVYYELREHPGTTDVQRAATHLYLLYNTFAHTSCFQSFSTGTERVVGGWGCRLSEAVWRIWHRLATVTVECLDFADLVARYDRPHTFFYCDPPYLISGAPYKHVMGPKEHRRLAEVLRGVKGKWLLSINDCQEARELYEGFTVEKAAVRYGIARDKSAPGQEGKELLIRNY